MVDDDMYGFGKPGASTGAGSLFVAFFRVCAESVGVLHLGLFVGWFDFHQCWN